MDTNEPAAIMNTTTLNETLQPPHDFSEVHRRIEIMKSSRYPILRGPYDSAQINGLYGPGTWGAWVLAMASSAIALYKIPGNHTALTLIPPILYIEWAAVDILTQISHDTVSFELLASATAICTWGLWYFLLVQVILSLPRNNAHASKRGRLRFMALVSSILPFAAVIASVIYVGMTKSDRRKPNSYPGMSFAAQRYMWTRYLNDRREVMRFVLILTGVFVAQASLAISPRIRRRFEVATSKWPSFSVLYIMLEWPLTCHSLLSYFFSVTRMEGSSLTKQSCLLRPCAPQSIRESDQGFSLCCGLLLLAFETAPGLKHYVRAMVKRVNSQFTDQRPAQQRSWPGHR